MSPVHGFLIVVWTFNIRSYFISRFHRRFFKRIHTFIDLSHAPDYRGDEKIKLLNKALLWLQVYDSRDHLQMLLRFWKPIHSFYPNWLVEEINGTSTSPGALPPIPDQRHK